MNSIAKQSLKWLYHGTKLAIMGAMQSVGAKAGLTVASEVGANVPNLSLQGMGVVAITGAAVSLWPYLMKSPLPTFKELEGDTETITKPKDQ